MDHALNAKNPVFKPTLGMDADQLNFALRMRETIEFSWMLLREFSWVFSEPLATAKLLGFSFLDHLLG